MRLHFFFLLFAMCLGTVTTAQTDDRGVWVGFSRGDGRMYGGPDPENPTHLVDVLKRHEFHIYLGVTPEQCNKINEVLRTLPRPTRDIVRSSAAPELTRHFESLIDDAIKKTISDLQYTRLKQLCYRIEIGILGFPNAVAYGTLADTTGVHDNQRTHIYVRSAFLAKEAYDACEVLNRRAEEERIDLLPKPMRSAAMEALGPFFEFKYLPYRTSYANMSQDKIRAAEASILYRSHQVRMELGLTDKQIATIDELLANSHNSVSRVIRQSNGNRLNSDEQKSIREADNAFFAAFDELFLPHQFMRLDQLILRNRIRQDGQSYFIQRLEEIAKIKLEKTERDVFLNGCVAIENTTKAAVDKVKAKLELRIADELSPEQKDAFIKAIGEYYEYLPTAVKPKSQKAIYPF